MPKDIEFWFEFGSTYSYLTVMRIEDMTRRAGVTVHWQAFLLGPIFQRNGWDTSPFNIYSAKGEHMWRDMARRASKYGLAFQRLPDEGVGKFPQNGLQAARIALVGLEGHWGRAFCKSVYLAQFAEGRDIADGDLLVQLARAAGAPEDVLERANTNGNKDRLRAQTEAAVERGIFGAPSFVVGEELFWGDDRLEDAIEWAIEVPASA